MANDRVYYAIQQVSFGKDTGGSSGTRTVAHGVQSIGITTTFNLEQVFELGQLAIYENVEGTPDVEVIFLYFALLLQTKPMGQPWLKDRTVNVSFNLAFGMKVKSLLVNQVQLLVLGVKCQVLLFPL